MPVGTIVLIVGYALNLLLLLIMIFVERKQPQSVFGWFAVLALFPIGGFVLYMLFGGGLSIRTRVYIRRKKRYTQDYLQFVSWQRINFDKLRAKNEKYDYAYKLIKFVKSNDNNVFSTGNSVKVFTDGPSKLESLKNDLKNAKNNINIEYYIFGDDKTGKEIMDILCQKARSGVKVKLIYDSVGSLKSPRRFFRKLKKAGGEVAEFFPPFMGIRLINFKINYRNHRKIVVIDGKIAYTGGINLRDDHMGKKKKVSPWRDTHIRVEGPVVWDLQNIFFNDFRCVKKERLNAKQLVKEGYFLEDSLKEKGNIGAQVITSGPESDQRYIEDAYIRMISFAQKRVYIQTPYFIPDEMFLKALLIAKKTGVDVKVMIPAKPDKRTVYYVTLSFVKELLDAGIEVYFYNGFLHSKTLLVDDLCVSIGTCNADNRSFALNFELTTLLYDKDFVNYNAQIFEQDMKNSKLLTLSDFNRKFFASKLFQAILRLFSPLL